MNQPNLLELARQGDANAIAALMNAVLEPKGITAKASLENGCLSVFLESAKTLNQQTMMTFIRRGILELGTDAIQTVKASGHKIGARSFSWVAEFEVHPVVLPETQVVNLEKEVEETQAVDESEEFAATIEQEMSDDRPSLTVYLKAYLVPTLLVIVVAFFGGGFVALISTSKSGNQTSEGESDRSFAGSPSQPRSPQQKQQAAEKYIKAMTQAQEKFYAQNKRFASTLEELERSANLISQSYDYTYRSRVLNTNRAQVTAIPKQAGLSSFVGTVIVTRGQTTRIVCKTNQPTIDAPPMPEFSQNQLKCQPSSSEVP
ncbi:type IV pilin-like G/H family protein [Phormidesmis sp. 146-35]